MGAVTPIGIGVDAYWSALVEGQCGVGKITRFDASELPVQIAAELKDFDPAAYMPKTLARTMDPFMQFAFVAAEEALKDSELSNPSNYHICSASTNSNPSSSINVCKPGLRSIIR